MIFILFDFIVNNFLDKYFGLNYPHVLMKWISNILYIRADDPV